MMQPYYQRRDTIKFHLDQHTGNIELPAYEIHKWLRVKLGIWLDQVQTVQIDNMNKDVYVKFSNYEQFKLVASRLGKTVEYKQMDGTVRNMTVNWEQYDRKTFKICDLPPEIPDNVIISAMSAYGEVLSLQHERWPDEYLFPLCSGVRMVQMYAVSDPPARVVVGGLNANVVRCKDPMPAPPTATQQQQTTTPFRFGDNGNGNTMFSQNVTSKGSPIAFTFSESTTRKENNCNIFKNKHSIFEFQTLPGPSNIFNSTKVRNEESTGPRVQNISQGTSNFGYLHRFKKPGRRTTFDGRKKGSMTGNAVESMLHEVQDLLEKVFADEKSEGFWDSRIGNIIPVEQTGKTYNFTNETNSTIARGTTTRETNESLQPHGEVKSFLGELSTQLKEATVLVTSTQRRNEDPRSSAEETQDAVASASAEEISTQSNVRQGRRSQLRGLVGVDTNKKAQQLKVELISEGDSTKDTIRITKVDKRDSKTNHQKTGVNEVCEKSQVLGVPGDTTTKGGKVVLQSRDGITKNIFNQKDGSETGMKESPPTETLRQVITQLLTLLPAEEQCDCLIVRNGITAQNAAQTSDGHGKFRKNDADDRSGIGKCDLNIDTSASVSSEMKDTIQKLSANLNEAADLIHTLMRLFDKQYSVFEPSKKDAQTQAATGVLLRQTSDQICNSCSRNIILSPGILSEDELCNCVSGTQAEDRRIQYAEQLEQVNLTPKTESSVTANTSESESLIKTFQKQVRPEAAEIVKQYGVAVSDSDTDKHQNVSSSLYPIAQQDERPKLKTESGTADAQVNKLQNFSLSVCGSYDGNHSDANIVATPQSREKGTVHQVDQLEGSTTTNHVVNREASSDAGAETAQQSGEKGTVHNVDGLEGSTTTCHIVHREASSEAGSEDTQHSGEKTTDQQEAVTSSNTTCLSVHPEVRHEEGASSTDTPVTGKVVNSGDGEDAEAASCDDGGDAGDYCWVDSLH